MTKANLTEIRQKTAKELLLEKAKKQEKLIVERSSLASAGKKNSNTIKKMKKEIARIDTILTEKLYQHEG